MAGGRHYSAKEDAAIRQAVADGARTEADFRPLGLILGRPYQTLRHRALRLELIEPRTRTPRPPKSPEVAPADAPRRNNRRGWDPEEDAFLVKAREQGQTVREIGLALGRSWSGVEGRLLQLGARERVVRDYVHDPEPDRSVQTGACAKHARACLRAGGFWAFSERRVGAGKWAVCLPMLPPPAHLWGAGQ